MIAQPTMRIMSYLNSGKNTAPLILRSTHRWAHRWAQVHLLLTQRWALGVKITTVLVGN